MRVLQPTKIVEKDPLIEERLALPGREKKKGPGELVHVMEKMGSGP